MEALREMRCVAFRSDAPTVTEAEIAELLPQVSEWEIVEQEGIKKLSRVFRFDDFAKALAFTTARLVDEGARMVFVNGAISPRRRRQQDASGPYGPRGSSAV